MSNPFDPPQALPAAPAGAGRIDVGAAFQTAVNALQSHFVVLVVGHLAFLFLSFLAVLMCIIPAFFVFPVLYWGMLKILLRSLDQIPSLDDLFSGFQDFVTVWPQMILYLILAFLIAIPGSIAGEAANLTLSAMGGDSGALGVAGGFLSMVISGAWTLGIVVRFFAAPYLVVDEGLSATDALLRSWNLTGGSNWPMVILLTIAGGLLNLLGVLMCLVGVLVTAPLVMTWYAAAVRQMTTGR